MKTNFEEDQGRVLAAIQASEGTDLFALQDRTQVLVYQGKVIATANPITKPLLSVRNVESLDSLALIAATHKEEVEVFVATPTWVVVLDVSEPHNHQVVAKAITPVPKATILTEYVSLDEAMIQLREGFEPSQMIDDLIKTLSTIKIEDITQLKDNGFGINVAVETRVTGGKADATVFQMALTALRTFPEIEALPSTFMMRWRRDGEAIRVRLIEQQEGAWRLLQKQKIQTYLQSLLPDCSILL